MRPCQSLPRSQRLR